MNVEKIVDKVISDGKTLSLEQYIEKLEDLIERLKECLEAARADLGE